MTESNTQLVAILTASRTQPAVDEITSEEENFANTVSTGSPTELLDLPTEIRLMIFRHLLVYSQPRQDGLWARSTPGAHFLSILRTNRLIYREAFDVMYRETQFTSCLSRLLLPPPQFLETIQHIHQNLFTWCRVGAKDTLLRIMQCFGASCDGVQRGSLTLDFRFFRSTVRPLKWFIRALGRFTNFRTIELHFYHSDVRDRNLHVIEYFEHALEPILGHSKYSSREGRGLLFDPIDHRNRLRAQNHGDWADSLDGIRLGWNYDVVNTERF